jgi:hypothetical protein
LRRCRRISRPAIVGRLSQYLDDVREIERRIQRAESAVPEDVSQLEVPSGVPSTFAEHLKLLMDLQVIAFQSEITRVSTLMFARELSTAVYPRRRFAIRSTTCRITRTIAATWIASRSSTRITWASSPTSSRS